MDVIDHNGQGRWSAAAIQERYAQFAGHAGISPRDLSPLEHTEPGRRWIHPVMQRVIEGIEADDVACVWIGIEFIEEDGGFSFGKILKANTARALRRAILTESQRQRIRRRVFAMLAAGNVPHEYREYAKLVRKIGFAIGDVPEADPTNARAMRFRAYFEQAATGARGDAGDSQDR